ncbi:F-box protein At5g67140-like [Mercurialis annua]|uniref:F-box protein At5g67140-like n=1 Tax=Mercurialis annua TaxID=3986 RepID=UPI00215F7431|nr:F-box protein At5g67140-like [Mercurialis annua]
MKISDQNLEEEAEINRLPVDLLARIFLIHTELTLVSGVCKKWREAMKVCISSKKSIKFAGFKMNDQSTAFVVRHAYSLKELDISFHWEISDDGLCQISLESCITNLTSISLWGITRIGDRGVVPLMIRAKSLEHLNVGGTFISDDTLYAVADNCPHLKSLVLWSCYRVTEKGVEYVIRKCRKLEWVNAWGTKLPFTFSAAFRTLYPSLRINQGGFLLHI